MAIVKKDTLFDALLKVHHKLLLKRNLSDGGDLSKLNGPEFEQFLKSLDDVNIEVDDGKSQVRITCE